MSKVFLFEVKLPCRECGNGKAVIAIEDWVRWHLAESPCIKKYGALFGRMMGCGKAVRNPSDELKREAIKQMELVASEEAVAVLATAWQDSDYKLRAGAAYVLGKIGDVCLEQAVSGLMHLMRDEYSYIREHAEDAFLKIGVGVVPYLKMYEGSDPHIVCLLYKHLGGEDEVDFVVANLLHKDSEVRDKARKALGAMLQRGVGIETVSNQIIEGAPALVEALCDVISGLPNMERGGRLEQALLWRLDNRPSDVRLPIIRCLGVVGGRDAAIRLASSLNASSPLHNKEDIAAFQAIKSIGDPIVKDAVFDCYCQSPNENIRIAALDALSVIGDAQARERIKTDLASRRGNEKQAMLITLLYLADSEREKKETLLEIFKFVKEDRNRGGMIDHITKNGLLSSSLELWDDEIIEAAREAARQLHVGDFNKITLNMLIFKAQALKRKTE